MELPLNSTLKITDFQMSFGIHLIFFSFFFLQKIERSGITLLDRWSITITNQKQTDDESSGSKDNLASMDETEEGPRRVSEKIPFNIINNYFSIGVVSEKCNFLIKLV